MITSNIIHEFLLDIVRLKDKDLAEIKGFLWRIRTHWRAIGVSLGIDSETLNEINKTGNGVPGDCLGTVIHRWLLKAHKPDHPITWSSLVLALQKDPELEELSETVVQDILGKHPAALAEGVFLMQYHNNQLAIHYQYAYC